MILSIDVDNAHWRELPELKQLTRAAVLAAADEIGKVHDDLELAILFTDDERMAHLNTEWRNKSGATNVLSFPAEDFPLPAGEPKPLGDIVLAEGVVTGEALQQGKTLPQHLSHLIIHGFLHLAGYDHENDREAQAMEELEIAIMKKLGFPNPYE